MSQKSFPSFASLWFEKPLSGPCQPTSCHCERAFSASVAISHSGWSTRLLRQRTARNDNMTGDRFTKPTLSEPRLPARVTFHQEMRPALLLFCSALEYCAAAHPATRPNPPGRSSPSSASEVARKEFCAAARRFPPQKRSALPRSNATDPYLAGRPAGSACSPLGCCANPPRTTPGNLPYSFFHYGR